MIKARAITNCNRWKRWARKDIEYLKRSYGKCKSSDLAGVLNRTRRAIVSKAQKLKIKSFNIGISNGMWKGDNVKYDALHAWIRSHKPKPEFCEECNLVPPFELANISGEYKRDVKDFRWLCRSCHSKEHRGIEWHNKIFKFRKIKMR